jgi:N-acetylneuraminic acid mutarotase/DNA-binding transcriptional ArsR family regulator
MMTMKKNGPSRKRMCKVSVTIIALLSMVLLMAQAVPFVNGTGSINQMGKSGDPQPLANNGWINVTTPVNPGMLLRSSMSYDSESDRAVLFGGMNYNGSESNETWTYDYESNTWTKMSPSLSPAPRERPAMTYDNKSDRIILFGGYVQYNPVVYNETWAYDLNTNTWTNMSPLNSPPSRFHPGIAYDSQSDRVIMFSGDDEGGSSIYDDTWAYDYNNNTWTNMTPAFSPVARVDPKMAYDPIANRIVMFGGGMGPIGSFNSWNDTWTYDYERNTWTNMSPIAPPAPYIGASMIYDSSIGKVILLSDDTWSYELSTNTWEKMNLSSRPTGRYGKAMAYDEGGEAIVMYGGANDTMFFTETWIYQTNASPPVIVTTLPTNGTKNVNVNSTITITFNKAMSELATEGAISSSPLIQWNAAWTSQRRTLTLVPSSDLQSGATYTITISKGAKGENGMTLEQEYAFIFITVPTIPTVPVSPGIGEKEVIAIVIVSMAVAATATAFMGVEWLLYAMFILLLPLYAKIKREKVLDNFMRGRIYQFIINCPGAHLRFIKKNLGVEMGVLSYHLNVLERSGLIRSEKRETLKRFFCTSEKGGYGMNEYGLIEKDILTELNLRPGQGIRSLSMTLNKDRQVIAFCIHDLIDKEAIIGKRTVVGITFLPIHNLNEPEIMDPMPQGERAGS